MLQKIVKGAINDKMEIRFGTDKDKEAIKDMIMYCFSRTERYAQFFVENIFKAENCIGCYDGERLGAALHIHPFEMFFYGKTVPMGGIGSVATLPEYRHCHCASRMLIEALKIMRDRGDVFSGLAPFSFAFYRKYGWEMAFHKKEYHLLMEDLKGFGTGKGNFKPLDFADIPRLAKVYESFARSYNGAICRNDENWELVLKKHERDGLYRYGYEDESGELRGYIFYRLEDKKFHINELIYSEPRVKGELLRFVYYHSAQADEVIWQAPADDNTFLMLDNPRREQRIIPGMMIRAVDVRKLLEMCPFPQEYSGSFTIVVDDPWAQWNDSTFKLDIEEGHVQVKDIGKKPGDIQGSIQCLSQMLFGYTGIKEAVETGKIEVKDLKLYENLQHIFKGTTTFVNDTY